MQYSKEVMEMLKENPPRNGLDYVMRVRGITNKSLAEQLKVELGKEVSPQNVSGWRDKRLPKNKEIMQSVSRVIGETVDFLFFQESGWEEPKAKAS